jgi:excisionase family DNA binding protein
MGKPEPWSSVDEVAAHLRASRDTIYRWIENAGLPASKVGRSWKLKLTAVDNWVRAGGAGKAPAPRRSGARR